MRVCAEPGCPELTSARRCATHATAHEQARGSSTARGYDTKHRKLRLRWVPRVAAGTVKCWRCGRRISPLEPWDLGHVDTTGLPRDQQERLPECWDCNRSTSSR